MYSVVFFGSSEYSVIILSALLSLPDFNLLAVITKPDKPVGRQQLLTPNPVAQFANDHHLTLYQTEIFDQQFFDFFSRLSPDLGLVVAYGPPFFTQELIDIPKFKIVNIHPSPLPKYRGATPGPWQIINGETDSAVSFFQIDQLPDHGPLIAQIPFSINSSETADSFYQKAFQIASEHLSEILLNYCSHPQSLTLQDHNQKTYFPKLSKDSAQIDWSWSADKIERFVRALNPWPVAWTYVTNPSGQKLRLKIFSVEKTGLKITPKIVQLEGKNTVSWDQISQSYKI
jgi:methionyl-tRNA formyltransferase